MKQFRVLFISLGTSIIVVSAFLYFVAQDYNGPTPLTYRHYLEGLVCVLFGPLTWFRTNLLGEYPWLLVIPFALAWMMLTHWVKPSRATACVAALASFAWATIGGLIPWLFLGF